LTALIMAATPPDTFCHSTPGLCHRLLK